jgi:hypothetical protein
MSLALVYTGEVSVEKRGSFLPFFSLLEKLDHQFCCFNLLARESVIRM